MADKIRVNTKSLDATKSNVSRQIKEIRRQIGLLYDDVKTLNGMWEGDAHDTFSNEFMADIRKLENLCGRLDDIVSYEDNAINEYQKCESKVSELISSISI